MSILTLGSKTHTDLQRRKFNQVVPSFVIGYGIFGRMRGDKEGQENKLIYMGMNYISVLNLIHIDKCN